MNRTERIAALMANEHNPVKTLKTLEAASDEVLDGLEASAAAVKTASEKVTTATAAVAEADRKTAAAVTAAAAAPATATPAPMTEEQWIGAAPASVKSLLEDKKAEDTARKTAIVTSLKGCQSEYTEDELNAMDLKSLERVARLAKVETGPADASYIGRAVPVARAAGANDAAPPDSYALGIAAMQTGK